MEGAMAIRLGLANIECCNGGGDGGGVDGGGAGRGGSASAKLFQVKILRRNP
jgi:hypothetical protein